METSNCDYVSEIFREQLSELEYSKLLADSDEKEITNQNMMSGSGFGGGIGGALSSNLFSASASNENFLVGNGPSSSAFSAGTARSGSNFGGSGSMMTD